MTAPRVSIVMPVYKGGDYFRFALRSALAQDWPALEIVVVDDGSPDGGETEAIAHEPRDPRIRYIRQENQGVAGALNTGIAAMTGDVFCWLSHDDLFLPDKTARQVEFHRRLGVRDAVLFSDYALIGPAGEAMGAVIADRDALRRHPMRALLTGSVNGCTIFAPAEVMKSAEPFRLEYRFTQDYRFWNALLRRHDLFHMPGITVRYRIHPEQGSNRPEAIAEAERLWIAMMEERSEVERARLHGSAHRFYAALARHLDGSPQRLARAHALRCAAETASPPLSLVLLDGSQAPEGLSGHAVPVRGGDLGGALRQCRGDYVGFVAEGAPTSAAGWRRRASDMAAEGAAAALLGGTTRTHLSLHDAVWRGPTPRPGEFMLHRQLIGEGFAPELGAFALDPLAAFLPHLRRHGLLMLGPDAP